MKHTCPICQSELAGMDGEKMHPGDKNYGYSLFCLNLDCSAEEVMGHGKNDKEAYEVILAKFVKKKG
jgi:hypothetical protein